MAGSIYISYGRPDIDSANKVARVLEKKGFRTYRSYSEPSLGSDESDDIYRNLTDAPAVVMILGDGTYESMFIVREISHACMMGKPVIVASLNENYELEGPLAQLLSDHGSVRVELSAKGGDKALVQAVNDAVEGAGARERRATYRTPEKPYTGNEPYVFISYAHKDKDEVFDIISRLQQEGCRVWYDEGIDPGTEWDEYIAGHIADCGCVISFISGNYINSNNCKDEINFARDLDKPRMLVYLEKTSLPLGMSMRLGRLQAIHAYTYDDRADFFRKLNEAAILDPCR